MKQLILQNVANFLFKKSCWITYMDKTIDKKLINYGEALYEACFARNAK